MSKLITVKLYVRDKSHKPLSNFKLRTYPKSRPNATMDRVTDIQGHVSFQASPNSDIGIDIIKPDGKFEHNCYINSKRGDAKPLIIGVNYEAIDYQPKPSGLITFKAKVVDKTGKVMKNFPLKTAYVNSRRSSDVKYTDDKGMIELYSSPNRDVRIKPLMPNNKFEEHSVHNIFNSSPPTLKITLNNALTDYKCKVVLHLFDKEGDDKYPHAKFKLTSNYFEGNKTYQDTNKDSKFPITTFIGDELTIQVYNPDGSYLKKQTFTVTRMQHDVNVKVPVSIVDTHIDQDDPTISKKNNGLCACGRDITYEELKKICPHAKSQLLRELLPYINKSFAVYNIDNCLRKAHFLAQVCHESGEFRYRAEIISHAKSQQHYGGYKGRGFMQLTFKGAYEKYGNYKGMSFLGANKVKLERDEYAIDSACWFWTKFKWKDLNQLSDKNDIIGISAIVNGGFNGFDDRIKYFKKAVDAFKIKSCSNITQNTRANILQFNFPDSIVITMVGESFGWGLWHDPSLNKKGCAKHSVVAKEGYDNFLKLAKTNSFRKRYGYTFSKAKQLATKRVKIL